MIFIYIYIYIYIYTHTFTLQLDFPSLDKPDCCSTPLFTANVAQCYQALNFKKKRLYSHNLFSYLIINFCVWLFWFIPGKKKKWSLIEIHKINLHLYYIQYMTNLYVWIQFLFLFSYLFFNYSLAFWLGRLTFVSDGYQTMADLRPKGPQLQLGHLRVGELQPLSLMYSTRPCCLV